MAHAPGRPDQWRARLYEKTYAMHAWDWKENPRPYIRALCQAVGIRTSLAGLDPKQACLNADTCNGDGLCFCEDKQLNNGELAIDCGGSCLACGTWNCNCGAATGCCVCKSSCDEGTPVCTAMNGTPCKIGDSYLVAYASSVTPDANCTAQSLLTCSHKTCVCQ